MQTMLLKVWYSKMEKLANRGLENLGVASGHSGKFFFYSWRLINYLLIQISSSKISISDLLIKISISRISISKISISDLLIQIQIKINKLFINPD